MIPRLHRPTGNPLPGENQLARLLPCVIGLMLTFLVPAACPTDARSTIDTIRDVGSFPSPSGEECTIAIVTGAATSDGRPLFWKNRDTHEKYNEVVYFDDGDLAFVTLADLADSASAWLGVNEAGFAIMNALAHNLTDSLEVGMTNGELMKLALQTCGTVSDFEQLLFDMLQVGLHNPCNFAAMDATGGAAMYEAEHFRFTKYDVTDPLVAPDGYLVRTNFSLIADTSGVNTWRYHRAIRLIGAAAADGGVDITNLLDTARDLVSETLDPYPLPYEGAPPADPGALGFINTLETINRSKTAAFGVIRGVRPGEDPLLSTFYAGLGQPVLSIVLPVWVGVGPTPRVLDDELGSPLCDLALERYRTCYNHQLFTHWLNTFFLVHGDRSDGYLLRAREIEEWLIPAIEAHLQDWYEQGFNDSVAAAVEFDLAEAAFAEYQVPIPPPASIDELAACARPALTCWPNPMRQSSIFMICDAPNDGERVAIEIYDVTGRIVSRLSPDGNDRGFDNRSVSREVVLLRWDGRGRDGRRIAPGNYFFRTTGVANRRSGTIVVLP